MGLGLGALYTKEEVDDRNKVDSLRVLLLDGFIIDNRRLFAGAFDGDVRCIMECGAMVIRRAVLSGDAVVVVGIAAVVVDEDGNARFLEGPDSEGMIDLVLVTGIISVLLLLLTTRFGLMLFLGILIPLL